jgi:hypothetical protein
MILTREDKLHIFKPPGNFLLLHGQLHYFKVHNYVTSTVIYLYRNHTHTQNTQLTKVQSSLKSSILGFLRKVASKFQRTDWTLSTFYSWMWASTVMSYCKSMNATLTLTLTTLLTLGCSFWLCQILFLSSELIFLVMLYLVTESCKGPIDSVKAFYWRNSMAFTYCC